MRHRARWTALLTLAAACSHDATTEPAPRTLDVARLLGEMTPAVMSGVTAATPLGAAIPVLPPTAAGASCPYVAASRSFVCAPVTTNGLTLALTYTLLDAAGNPQAQGDATTTAAIHTVADVTGTITRAGVSTTVVAHADQTLSGLLGATHRLDGTATTRATTTAAGAAPALTLSATQTTAGLLLPASTGGAGAWPTGGTITSDLTLSGGATPATTAHVLVAFDGTSTAKLTITTNGATRHCTLNLAAPGAPACAA